MCVVCIAEEIKKSSEPTVLNWTGTEYPQVRLKVDKDSSSAWVQQGFEWSGPFEYNELASLVYWLGVTGPLAHARSSVQYYMNSSCNNVEDRGDYLKRDWNDFNLIKPFHGFGAA